MNIDRALTEHGRQIAGSHCRVEAVLNAIGDAIAMLEDSGRLVFANRAYESLMGLEQHELLAMTPAALAAVDRERFREPPLCEVETTFLPCTGTLLETTGSGLVPEQRFFHRSSMPVRDAGGDVIGNLMRYRDVSREIHAEGMATEVLSLGSKPEAATSFSGMVGNGSGMRKAYALIQQAAASDITVLVRGESGTGKELVARSVHRESARPNGPFVAMSCAAIAETLIESELFGHERGAFTGATSRRIGAFERAHGGSIMLDEIGDMPLVLQAKLLRVLQEREIQRVGGTTATPIDIRVIAATNRDLERAVEMGEFRRDLYYRVAAFPIVIPPLRERREDIPALVKHFLDRYVRRAGKEITGVSTAGMRALLQYDWPGNVRELEHAMERGVLLESGSALQVGSLPARVSAVLAGAGNRSNPTETAVVSLAKLERQALEHALEAAGHNVSRAARALGISRTTLHRKLKKLNLNRDRAPTPY